MWLEKWPGGCWEKSARSSPSDRLHLAFSSLPCPRPQAQSENKAIACQGVKSPSSALPALPALLSPRLLWAPHTRLPPASIHKLRLGDSPALLPTYGAGREIWGLEGLQLLPVIFSLSHPCLQTAASPHPGILKCPTTKDQIQAHTHPPHLQASELSTHFDGQCISPPRPVSREPQSPRTFQMTGLPSQGDECFLSHLRNTQGPHTKDSVRASVPRALPSPYPPTLMSRVAPASAFQTENL